MTDSASEFLYRLIGDEGWIAVEPLWEQQKNYHAGLAWAFADTMHQARFDLRRRELISKSAPGRLRIEIVGRAVDPCDVAFCISTVSADGRGEVDSLFVAEAFRSRGIGGELLRRALVWLDEAGASSKCVSVASANEGALALYRRFGFQPRTILLEQR